MQTRVPWGRDGNSLSSWDVLCGAVRAVYRPRAQPVVSVLLQWGWWALRLRAGWLWAEGSGLLSVQLPPHPVIEFQAMLRDASEGRPPEPPAVRPSACSQVRGQAASGDAAWGSELGPRLVLPWNTVVPVLCLHSPQN